MNRIIVGSIADAQRFQPTPGERYAVLSFIDVGCEPPKLERHDGFVERLVVHTDDCTPDDPPFAGRLLCPLSEAQARQIARFVRANADRIDTLVVHCHAGLSRSPGAATAIGEALQIAEIYMVNGENVIPNVHVRDLVRAALE
ncbi:MAG TPA: hypothetical protein VKT72_05610 [Candidatus Baltobacteraceae bacterium]|nr:hypothetical protein [Candidatus Baltobacteraceae bacterium]